MPRPGPAADHRVQRILTRDDQALTALGSGAIDPVQQEIWTDRTLTEAERARAAARAGVDRDIARPGARADYLARVEEIRFTSDWRRPAAGEDPAPAGLENAIERLATIRIPILLLHGRNDLQFPASHASYAAERLVSAEANLIENEAHMAHIDQPAAWSQAIRTFLHQG